MDSVAAAVVREATGNATVRTSRRIVEGNSAVGGPAVAGITSGTRTGFYVTAAAVRFCRSGNRVGAAGVGVTGGTIANWHRSTLMNATRIGIGMTTCGISDTIDMPLPNCSGNITVMAVTTGTVIADNSGLRM